MIDSIKEFFSKFQNDPYVQPPKWRLVPDTDGTYDLEKWDTDCRVYLCEKVCMTKEQADETIKNLERHILYYREASDEEQT